MNIHVMCRWPTASSVFDDPDTKAEMLVQVAVETLVEELVGTPASRLTQPGFVSSLEKAVQSKVEPALPMATLFDVNCSFASSNLMVIDVTPKPQLHIQNNGVLH